MLNASTNIEKSDYTIGYDSTPSIPIGRKITLGIIFSLIILTAINGNVLVCIAVLTDHRLKSKTSNYFVLSLAVADLFVGCIVMPFEMIMDIQNKWIFGDIFCRIWISSGVMCCTASIFSMSAIAQDRYSHIKNAMLYDAWMTRKKALMLIAFMWFLSALTSFLAVNMGWLSHEFYTSVDATYGNDSKANDENLGGISDLCVLNVTANNGLLCAIMGFYVPCTIMLVFYFKLFLIARTHAKSIRCARSMVTSSDRAPVSSTIESQNTLYNKSSWSLRRSDNKAAFTLGVVTGIFLCCWLPFFIFNAIDVHYPGLIPHYVFMVSTWLGYSNSCVNPFIYSIFNSEFRKAFKNIMIFRMGRNSWDWSFSSTLSSIGWQ